MDYASSPHNSQSVALAFAVAALQRGETPEQLLGSPRIGTESSSSSSSLPMTHATTSTTTTTTSTPAVSQPPGSGSQERHHDAYAEEEEDDVEKRLAKSRERNREHARRTRLRKKAHLESLQARVKELECERQALRQKMEECSIASILLGLSSKSLSSSSSTNNLWENTHLKSPSTPEESSSVSIPSGSGRRKRFYSDATDSPTPSEPLKVNIDGELTIIGGGCHVNWKTGMYSDGSGLQRKLTGDQLKQLRRERNRMHAKLTRDRKKCFISSLEKTIADLEADVQTMRDTLSSVENTSQQAVVVVTPSMSPAVRPTEAPANDVVLSTLAPTSHDDNSTESSSSSDEPPCKRVKHGFSLVG